MQRRRDFLRGSVALSTGVSLASLGGPAATAPVDPRAAVLASLLARNREKLPGRQRGGANHASMGLLAFASLGGTAEQLQTWGERVLAKRKIAFPAGGPAITAQSWQQNLGNMEALPGFRGFFDEQIVRRGIASTLRAYLPALLPGLSSVEFHCLIRTAYGVRFGDPQEVAVGLAYWAAAYLPLGKLAAPGRETEPLVILARLRELPTLSKPPRTGTWGDRIYDMSRVPEFAPAVASLRIGDKTLTALARTMVRLFVATNDGFAALHTVTGTHAYRVLEPHLPAPETGRAYLWQALVAYYLTLGAPAIPPPAPVKLPSWTKIVAAAVADGDDHSMKLADTAREEFAHHGDGDYARVAAFRLRLI
jgi:hypothetical protein